MWATRTGSRSHELTRVAPAVEHGGSEATTTFPLGLLQLCVTLIQRESIRHQHALPVGHPCPERPLLLADVDFRREVLPILSENCFECHGPDSGALKADLRLDIEEGEKDWAKLLKKISARNADDRMPLPRPANASSHRKLTPFNAG
ncbi:MAG: hypothetical protein CMO80_12845 [Verrucomicrobiales bacterium]|nr:hypothetical protein [Verrucomicrobiales bacterium]|tara:strand:- start:830 stop:1270 length:441 start_codon:yes stop_codon:yes gene_type:complete